MITITWHTLITGVLAVCVGFSSICVAGGWLIKIIKGLKKPKDNIYKKLDNDNERIIELQEDIKELFKIQPMILRSQYVILKHLRTNNSTGEIAQQEEVINDYLFNR